MDNFHAWIKAKYFEYQKSEDRVASVSEFALYIGVKQGSMSKWILGQSKPRDQKTIQPLVEKYGDEVYKVLGIEPPASPAKASSDERLNLLNRVWKLLPEAMKNEFADKAGRVKEQRRDGRKTKSGK